MLRKSIHVSLGLVSMLIVSGMANAQHSCSAKGMAGSWVVKCTGYLTPGPNAPWLPATLLGKASAEEDGNWSASGTLSLGGTIVAQDVKSVGPAELNPDCTGNITYSQTINGQPGPNIRLNFIVGKESEVIDGIGTDPGSVFACTLTRLQSKSASGHRQFQTRAMCADFLAESRWIVCTAVRLARMMTDQTRASSST